MVSNAFQDLDVDEISTNFFSDRSNPNTGRVKMFQQQLEEIDMNPDRPGALRQRDQTQDE